MRGRLVPAVDTWGQRLVVSRPSTLLQFIPCAVSVFDDPAFSLGGLCGLSNVSLICIFSIYFVHHQYVKITGPQYYANVTLHKSDSNIQ